ncbi:MAG: protein-methionine-sulfoxide reductase catalytic subunit MsrP [Acidobacteriota bacterium]|nr:protein-methionine-sulfoxide reductase catalytic subunit MsrP [Acidobacteriota bacterium]
MFIRTPQDWEIPEREITPPDLYSNRRQFLGVWGAVLAALGMPKPMSAAKLNAASKSPFNTDEKLTPLQDITHYNNYYEFGTGKEQPAEYARNLKTSPWKLTVEGAVAKKQTYDGDSLMKIAPLEERIYRHRCVEAWSIVVPWIGFPLSALLKQADPTAKAKFVAFETYYNPGQMPQAQYGGIPFPYVEGLRMDEAMHPLTLLALGLYGETMPNQNGAPIRLVVPWKYGFKSIKSLVKIKLVEKQPPTTWNLAGPREYGFYSNVNPEVDHPRWSQAKERRLGEFFKRNTIKFNGYGDQVASLYTGMDLRKNF